MVRIIISRLHQKRKKFYFYTLNLFALRTKTDLDIWRTFLRHKFLRTKDINMISIFKKVCMDCLSPRLSHKFASSLYFSCSLIGMILQIPYTIIFYAIKSLHKDYVMSQTAKAYFPALIFPIILFILFFFPLQTSQNWDWLL